MDKKSLNKKKKAELVDLVLGQEQVIQNLMNDVKDYDLTVKEIKLTYQELKKEHLKLKECRVEKDFDEATKKKLVYLESRYKSTGDKSYLNKRDKIMEKY